MGCTQECYFKKYNNVKTGETIRESQPEVKAKISVNGLNGNVAEKMSKKGVSISACLHKKCFKHLPKFFQDCNDNSMNHCRKIKKPLLKRRPGRLIIAIFLLVFLFPLSLSATQPAGIQLTILHVNDTHGYILPHSEAGLAKNIMVGGAARLARLIENERSKNPDGTLLLSAGDMFQGTPVSNVFRGKPVIEIMNHLKFDAMAVGNHEFDWGLDVFHQLLSSSRTPFLSANMIDKKGTYVMGVQPYIILQRNNVHVAIIGLVTPELPYVSKFDSQRKIIVQNPEDILPGLIKKVKDEGAQIIIVLSHLGVDQDMELARRVSGIHVIVGGHSHTALEMPLTIGSTTIVQAGCHGLFLGILELEIGTETTPVSYRTLKGRLVKILSGPDRTDDAQVAGIAKSYYDRIKDKFAAVVGETAVDLIRDDHRESNIGKLVCDMMKEATGADVAVINSRSIRTDIPKGKITLEQVYALLPFDNILVTMDLTGKQILEILEQGGSRSHSGLQVSGIKINKDISDTAGINDIYIGLKPLNPEKTYRVVTNDFLASKGDRYTTFGTGKNIQYGTDLRDAFLSYLKKYSPVHPMLGERIIMNQSYHVPLKIFAHEVVSHFPVD